jgi:uncharacterized protein (TIGR00251 family)
VSQASWFRWDGEDLLISVRVQPRARRDELGEPLGDELKVRITAPPVDGKANEHLVRFMADSFGVPIARVTLLAGGQGRSKRLCVAAPSRLPNQIAWA